tara:strand:- start:2225 stop:2389 length:165 start_codon:yes stop_codon:yes gene_type:complete
MPQVGNKKFPYTAAGMKAAKDAAKSAAMKNAAKKSADSKMTTLPAKSSKTKKKM